MSARRTAEARRLGPSIDIASRADEPMRYRLGMLPCGLFENRAEM